jgi:pimeloyl-ACP methyl ester carboxylesterase
MGDYKTVTLHDGRTLAYAEYGAPSGAPTIGFHGMPGSRYLMKALDRAAKTAGASIIAPDRPGYGMSSPHRRGSLLGYANDVAELADALGVDRFSVLGVSGGGPNALACAYALPDRITVGAVVSGIGPLRVPGSMNRMATPNRLVFTLGRLSPALIGVVLPLLIKSSLPSMEKQLAQGGDEVSGISREYAEVVVEDQREAIRQGGKGIAYDVRNLWRPWGFKLRNIETRVLLWHGDSDDLAPTKLARYIAGKLRNCRATYYPGESHIEPITRHGEEILATIVRAHEEQGAG